MSMTDEWSNTLRCSTSMVNSELQGHTDGQVTTRCVQVRKPLATEFDSFLIQWAHVVDCTALAQGIAKRSNHLWRTPGAMPFSTMGNLLAACTSC